MMLGRSGVALPVPRNSARLCVCSHQVRPSQLRDHARRVDHVVHKFVGKAKHFERDSDRNDGEEDFEPAHNLHGACKALDLFAMLVEQFRRVKIGPELIEINNIERRLRSIYSHLVVLAKRDLQLASEARGSVILLLVEMTTRTHGLSEYPTRWKRVNV